jgi:methionyl-tRNA formyltransferase
LKILIISNNERGLKLIDSLKKKFDVSTALSPKIYSKIDGISNSLKIPKNINNPNFIKKINQLSIKLVILAGFNQIISKSTLITSKSIWINLHAGDLPLMRGSSPLNWALIKDHKRISINIIKVEARIDSGDIIETRNISINKTDNIKTLHNKANLLFPKMALNAIKKISKKQNIKFLKQKSNFSYYPIRFPEDGLILFDKFKALEIHNIIRALIDPYPNAYTFHKNHKIKITESRIPKNNYFGEAGRIYKIVNNEILVCAKDKSLWIKTEKKPEFYRLKKYFKLATLTEAALNFYENR